MDELFTLKPYVKSYSEASNHHPSSRILAEKYKSIKNLSTIRYAKIKHTTQIVKSIENPQESFRYNKLGYWQKHQTKNQYLLRFPPRKWLLEKIDIASVFNEFFSSIGQQLLNDIDHSELVALDYFDFSMSFKPVTSGEVEETKNFLRACTSSCVRDILTVVIKILETVSSLSVNKFFSSVFYTTD